MMPSSAIGWAASLGAAFTWSFSVMMYRKWGVGRSATWLNLFKGTVALVFFGAAAAISGGFGIISMNVLMTLAVSGIVGVFIGDSAFFAALIRVGGTLTSAIQCLAPSLTAVLAWLFLGETLRPAQILGLVITSTCLALLVISEARIARRVDKQVVAKNGYFFVGIVFALVAAVSQAAGAVIARPAIDGLSPFISASLRLWAPVLFLLGWQIYKNRGFFPTVRTLVRGHGIIPMAMASFAGTFLGLTLMMYGMANAPLGVALALSSTYPVWILMGEYIVGKSSIGRWGALLVIGSVGGIWLMI